MFNLSFKGDGTVVLSAVVTSILLLSVSSSLPYSISEPTTITSYANEQTSSSVENALGVELLDTATNATTNTDMAQDIEENKSGTTLNKTGLKDILPLLFDDTKQETNQSNVTSSNAAGGGSVAAGSSEVTADFNGDGFEDKAIGVPYEDIDSNNDGIDDVSDAGVVHVIYGSSSGLSTTSPVADQLWQQGQNGLDDVAESRDYFGWALSSGDYNGDGFSDLAVGVPYEEINSIPEAGAVQIIYGSMLGLSTSNVLEDQLWRQDMPNIETHLEDGDHFGWSLSSGDYNGDGRDDIAIGIPDEDFTAPSCSNQRNNNCGMVQIIYGSTNGVRPFGSVLPGHALIQGMLHDVAEARDYFGWTLSSGDYNGDGRDDLSIGAPGENLPEVDQGGVIRSCGCDGIVHVIYGSEQGLSTTAVVQDQIWNQGLHGTQDVAEDGDFFGWTLSSGDYNGDGFSDLAIGVPNEDIGYVQSAGIVQIIYGSPLGLSTFTVLQDQLWQQGQNGLDGVVGAFDKFGWSLSSGDYNGDGRDDIAIGAPFERISGETIPYVGNVHVIYGSSSGLSTTSPVADQLWQQGQNGLNDFAERGDMFGRSLSSGDYNGDGRDDLVIGVPGESIAGETIHGVGKMHIIYGSSSGLSTTSPLPDQLWQQGLNGLDDVAEEGDRFGAVQ